MREEVLSKGDTLLFAPFPSHYPLQLVVAHSHFTHRTFQSKNLVTMSDNPLQRELASLTRMGTWLREKHGPASDPRTHFEALKAENEALRGQLRDALLHPPPAARPINLHHHGRGPHLVQTEDACYKSIRNSAASLDASVAEGHPLSIKFGLSKLEFRLTILNAILPQQVLLSTDCPSIRVVLAVRERNSSAEAATSLNEVMVSARPIKNEEDDVEALNGVKAKDRSMKIQPVAR
ncbi:uncharacterized protein BDZ99DRAFT_525844 [Mytilinidion resinicola]|uniref:Uncharacterized protein n=1 Tax=Mytilinidion resinicola TaxID=574789 RepID=A0A6A6Y8U8_9PEZI|nr:uncharacterized protein BDZ99DRAFT_525844 [Mytilinidion resinicola]KAF2804247.1 hypothetical protein BDZ99DRAFT_525844 [Mytilinidion resinicola]